VLESLNGLRSRFTFLLLPSRVGEGVFSTFDCTGTRMLPLTTRTVCGPVVRAGAGRRLGVSMNNIWKMLGPLVWVVIAPACAGNGDSAKTQPDEAKLPACKWPASLDGPDAFTTACVASRTELKCGPVNTVPSPPDAAADCTNQCMSSEYGVSCGGPGVAVPLPSGCRSLVAGPGGSVQGCCPCGS
jgi:hypothetical protein